MADESKDTSGIVRCAANGELSGGVEEYALDRLARLVPLPQAFANKYSRGMLTAVVGSASYPGAACLVAVASQRMGAGYTLVITDPAAVAAVRAASPSLVVRDLTALRAQDLVPSRAQRPCAYVVGSGFDAAAPESAQLTGMVLSEAQAPVLVDGGGLAMLATDQGQHLLAKRAKAGLPTVVTPHAGEAARLAAPFSLPVDDAAKLARDIARAYGVVCLLKGPESFISDGCRTVRMAQGSPALAKAGTGDVLAGMVGALLAQGMDAVDACVLGSTLHARAGRIAEARLTPVCVVAEDLTDALPEAVASMLAAR